MHEWLSKILSGSVLPEIQFLIPSWMPCWNLDLDIARITILILFVPHLSILLDFLILKNKVTDVLESHGLL